MSKMKEDKIKWIIDYIKHNGPVDILHQDFVDAYLLEFKPPYAPTNFGAHKCPELGALLSKCYKQGILKRGTVGIQWMPGFPKWVYTYDMSK